MNKKVALALLSMILVPLALMAQSVTISPASGNLIAALTSGGEVGYENGGSAMWRHEQLPLTFTVSDNSTLTDAGETANPAGDMRIFNEKLVVHGGASPDLYCVLSLPKGYRFKGYKIVLLNNLNGVVVGGQTRVGQNKVMYETNRNFDTSNFLARGCYADATNPNLTASYTMGSTNSDTREYVLTRMSETTNDMGNQLYFRVTHAQSRFFAVTIKSFTVYFTAEGTFEAEVKPMSTDVALSLVRSPFKTNKLDIGKLENREKNGQTFFAYTYANVRDIDAHAYIYQEDAIAGGIPMNVPTTKKIHPVSTRRTNQYNNSNNKNYYAFDNGTYYVEAPTQVYSQTGLSYPIGYRIVGAKFTPRWLRSVTGATESRTLYYITYTSGGTTYYLNEQLHFTTTEFAWNYDSNTHNVYIGSSNNAEYLACEGSGGERRLTLSYANGSYYNLSVSGTEIGWVSDGYYLRGTTDPSATVLMTNDAATDDHAQVSSRNNQSITFASYNPGSFTLNVYDKTGTTVVGTATKNAADTSDNGVVIDLTSKNYGYNNDAIKFEITGLSTGCQAIVDVSIFLQALNPYIDQMNIVCHDADDQMSLSQPFTAEDFRVSGGQFNFYIPSGLETVNFTFENLYSQYGDNSYYSGTDDGYARYSFVTSPYFSAFDGVAGNKITPKEAVSWNNDAEDGGLYDTRYIGTASDVQPGANIAYDTKVYATKVGNIRFKFNNAEGLSNTDPDPDTNYLEEYPFSVANYVGSTNPDGGFTTGAFVDCEMDVDNSESTTYYVFTADETRYNIAPSTAWQHRYYAFYRMNINLQSGNYDPKLTWTKVYDETCYNKEGNVAKDAMWGLKLETVESGTSNVVTGYLTVEQIDNAISAALTASGTNHPTSFDQILYVDGSELYSIISNTKTTGEGDQAQTTNYDLEYLKDKLADNVLIYLPANTTSTLDNCAYKPANWTTGGAFHAGKDIVLTDNRPFYAPYDIYLDPDKKILHERMITVPKNGKVTSASIIMPFNILINEEGVHTSLDGTSFKLHQMAAENCLTTGEGEDFVYFPVYKGVRSTTPNTPYLVEVLTPPDDDTMSFTVSQKGGTVKATPISITSGDLQYTYPGESGSGKKGNTTYNFTNHGSYSGKLVEKEKNIFYYAKNMFLCSADYVYDDGIKVAPFRAYYSSTSNTTTRAASPLKAFDIIPASLGDINIDGVVTKDDANGILNVILGKEEPKRLQTIMSDVNNDGTITIADVTKLVNMVLQNQAQTEEE